MEPAMKRRKLGQAHPDTEDEDDELDLEPDELNERRDPAAQLARGRAKAVDTLRSRFEHIFAKYEKDFTGIGDEIDLSTGELVVDNGHLSSLRDMKDWIVNDDDGEGSVDEDDDDDEVNREAETGTEKRQKPVPGSESTGRGTNGVQDAAPRDPWRISESIRASGSGQKEQTEIASSSARQSPLTNLDGTDQAVAREPSVSIDQAWQAPELPSSAFLPKIFSSDGCSKGRHYGSGTPVATRTALRRSLPAPENSEADEADDLSSLRVSAPATKDAGSRDDGHLSKSSPLIKQNFPTVSSSPRDNGLTNLIQDVLENIPDTPPSIRTSSITKSQCKALPLGQKPRLQVGANSTLIISKSAPNDNPCEPPKQRGRPPKSRSDAITDHEDSSGKSDQTLWDSSDLDKFIDVTNLKQINTPGKTWYIDIRARRCVGEEIPTVFERSGTIKDNHGQDVGTSLQIQQGFCDQHIKGTGLSTHEENITIATAIGRPGQSGDFKSQESFSRNVADPDFCFSDEERLLPRRRSKNKLQLDRTQLTLVPRKSQLPKQSNVRDHTQPAAEHRQNVLQRERKAAAERVLLQNHVLVAFPAPSSSTHVTPTSGSSLERGSSSKFSPTPNWLQQSVSYEPQVPSQIPKPVPDLTDASLDDLSRDPRHQPTPAILKPSKTGAVACLGNNVLLPNQKKRSFSKADRTDSAGSTAFPNPDPLFSLTNEQSAYNLQHGLTRKNGAPDTTPQIVEARKQAVQAQTPTADLTEQYTVEYAEPRTTDSNAKGKTHSRRSVRIYSRPDAAEETTTTRGTLLVRETGAKKVSMKDVQPVSPAISRITTKRSSDEEEHDPSYRQVDLRSPLSAEQLLPHLEDDMDLYVEDMSPIEKVAEHGPAQAGCETLRKPAPKTIQQAIGCIREGFNLASQKNKTTAQEPFRGANQAGDDDLHLSPSIAQQRIEMDRSAPVPSHAARETSQTKARPISQPTTPRRPRAKKEKKIMPSSCVNESMISLLSDSEDSADEISFSHSDFTPSGHHRILVHRKFPELSTTTPRVSASASATKKHRASGVLYGRSHSASSHKVLKNIQTPRLAGEGGAASHRLARSVVTVAHKRDLDDERDGSVIQTPRGTKRRCGVGGWRCERDFCFVCM